jgi:hypothetical protein
MLLLCSLVTPYSLVLHFTKADAFWANKLNPSL